MRLSAVIDPLGKNKVKYEYWWDGKIKGIYYQTGSNLNDIYAAERFYYNYIDQLTTKIDRNGNHTNYTYDKAGRIIIEELPFDGQNKTIKKYRYDGNGNVIEERISTNYPGEEEEYSYTYYEYEFDQLTSVYQIRIPEYLPNQYAAQTTSYVYDDVGNIKEMIIGQGYTFEYDSAKDIFVKKYCDLEGHKYTYDYNGFGLLSKITDPLGYEELYTMYDNQGRLLEMRKKDGKWAEFDYDYYGNLSYERHYSSGINIKEYDYTYFGKPKYIYDLFKSLITYDYDSFGRVIKETRQNYNNNITQTTEYTYDANNNATSLIVKVNNSVIQNLNYEYTYGNKLERVLKNSSEIASYEYNQAGLLEKYMTPINAVEYFYNQQNLLTQMINYKDRNMSQVDSTFTYTYYLNGNQASKTEVNGTTRYEYDSLGRLKKEYAPDETVTYDYDFLGNRIKKEVTNSQNPYTVNYNYNITLLTSEQKIVPSTNETEYTYYNYDPLGNLISKTYEKIAPSTGSDKLTFDATESAKYTTMYEYDPYNKLARVINENGEIEFNYYADGLRYSKTVNGAKTYYIWNGSNIIAETDANGSLITNYYRGLQIIASETPSDNVGLKYYSYNGHGDVFKLTDRNKNVIVSYEYDAFGNQKNSIANDTNPFRYCGEYFDGETGLIYLRARYYDPATSRMLTEDPYWRMQRIYEHNSQGLNLYVYCGNNPLMFIDPSGLDYIIGWSYSNADIKDFNDWLYKNGYSDTLMSGTDNWTDAHWAEFESRDAFSRAAQTRRDELIAMGIPADEIHLRRIDSRADLESAWADWAKIDIVEGLDFYSHVADVRGGSGDFWDNAAKLNWGSTLRELTIDGKKTGYISTPYAKFYGCYTATGDFAQNFANRQGVTTYGNEGGANFSYSADWRLPWHCIDPRSTKTPVYLGVYNWAGKRVPMTRFSPK